MNSVNLYIVQFCAEEVARQYRTSTHAPCAARAVAHMVEAWQYAATCIFDQFTPVDIAALGRMIEPEANKNGFRQIPVRVSDKPMPHPNEIEDRVHRWAQNVYDMRPEEAYKEMMEIHPLTATDDSGLSSSTGCTGG